MGAPSGDQTSFYMWYQVHIGHMQAFSLMEYNTMGIDRQLLKSKSDMDIKFCQNGSGLPGIYSNLEVPRQPGQGSFPGKTLEPMPVVRTALCR